jgi:acyl-CoA synthetase (NDP forming)
MSNAKVEALLNPRSVAILGAREEPTGWTARIFANLQRFGFPGPVYPINPRTRRIWGVECYPDLAALPSAPDHLVIMRAAATVPEALREGVRLGARSATLYAAGFAEMGTDEGRRLQAEVAGLIAETGMGVSGPNCLGNLSAPARMLTLPDDRIQELAVGPVAIVGQSGTATPAIGRTLMNRGIGVSYIVTSGNEIGLAAADYIDFYTSDPHIRVIFCMIEAVRRPADFLAACRRARDAGKPVVALKMGGSAGGRAVALAHTGSLAGAIEAFEAVAGDAGVIRAVTADDAVNLIEYLVAAPAPPSKGVGVLVYSGGLSGLAGDAAERHGIPLPAFSPATVAKMKELLGPEQRVSNPLDAAGFVNLPIDKLIELAQAVRNDPAIGAVLMQEDVPPSEGENEANRRRAQRVLNTLEAIDQRLCGDGGKPIGLISVNSADLTPFGRKQRARFPRVPVLNEPERAFRVLRAVGEWRDRQILARNAVRASPSAERDRFLASWRGLDVGTPLSEPHSKALLHAYGIRTPKEEVAATPDAAADAARRIGLPVVVKAVAAKLTHKSDAGAVMLGLDTPEAVHAACQSIAANVRAYDASIELEGFLVAEAISGGVELVLGIQNDPEMGPVVMFGSGGVLLELVGDVAFGVPGLGRAAALAMVERTKAGRLLKGYRGRGASDIEAVIDAIVATGRIAADVGQALQSMDINPLVALPAGRGAVALDALVIVGRAPQET